MSRVRRVGRDQIVVSGAISLGLVIAGFGAFLLAWRGASIQLSVVDQIPFAVSGGVGGLCLIGVGLVLLYVQVSRRLEAYEELLTDAVLDELDTLAGAGSRVSADPK